MTSSTLLHALMPDYTIAQLYSTTVKASAAETYAAIQRLDLSKSFLVRLLFRLRGMPVKAITLAGLQRIRFNLLAEVPNQEIVLGLIGKFWTARGHLQAVSPEQFQQWQDPTFAKAGWSIWITPAPDGTVLLNTETRIHCLSPAVARKFKLYWYFISPFSGLIRTETLRLIRADAEAAQLAST